jgi:hypothetical protein
MKEKKPFKETGFGKFISKVGSHLGTIVNVAAEVATGDIGGAIEVVRGAIIEGKIEDTKKAELLKELEANKMQWMTEMYQLEIRDRESARNREVSLAQAGHRDWFQYIVGTIGLILFSYLVWFITQDEVSEENREIFVHLLGIIEGVVLSIFSYYFGSSLGSKLKELKR